MWYESRIMPERMDRKAPLRRPTYQDMKALGLAPATNFDRFNYERARDSVILPDGMEILKSTGVLDSFGRPTYRLDEETLRYVRAAASYQRRNRPDFDADVPAERAGDNYGSDKTFARHERSKNQGFGGFLRKLALGTALLASNVGYALGQQSNTEYVKPSYAIAQSVSPEATGPKATGYIYNDRGDQLPLNVEGFQGGPTADFPISLTDKKIYSIKLTGNGALQTGWLKVVTDKGKVIPLAQIAVGGDPGQPRYETNLTAFVQDNDVSLTGNFTAYQNGLPPATVGVLPSETMRASVVPVEMSGTSMTGKALANLKNVPNECLSILYDDGKSIVSETLFTLEPNGHVAQFINQEFPNTPMPAKGMVQTVCEYPVAVLALQLQGAGMTSIPAVKGKGDYHSNFPILTAADMFDNGTLREKDAEKLPPVKNGQVRYKSTATGQEIIISFNDEGYSKLRTTAGQPAKLAPGKYERTTSAQGYGTEVRTVTFPDTPEIVQMPDLRYFNMAFANKVMWRYTGIPEGTNLQPAEGQAWKFYFDTRNTDLSHGTTDRLVRDAFKHFVSYELPQSGFMAGGKPLGGAENFIETNNPPPFRTPYSYFVDRNLNDGAPILVGIEANTTNYQVVRVALEWPRGPPNAIDLGAIQAIGSDFYAIFGLDDNDININDPQYGMSQMDTIFVERVDPNTGPRTPYMSPKDKYLLRFKVVTEAGTKAEPTKFTRPEKK